MVKLITNVFTIFNIEKKKIKQNTPSRKIILMKLISKAKKKKACDHKFINIITIMKTFRMNEKNEKKNVLKLNIHYYDLGNIN